MAGDWLKIEVHTPDKPEIWTIAGLLNIDPDEVFGKLFRMWSWFDQHTENGYAPSVTKKILDRTIGVAGFCDAVIESGWLEDDGKEIHVPNFELHNGKSSKNRALANRRMKKSRSERNVCDDVSVTGSDGGRVTKAQPEKRREDNKENKQRKFIPPSLEDVSGYCAERGNGIDAQKFIDHYSANGWMRGKTKIKDWKACVRTWEQRSGSSPQQESFGAGAI